MDHVGGSAGLIYGGGKSYRPPPSVRLSISLWKVRWMFAVEMYARVRRACMVEGMSVREASRVFGLHRDTVRKMLAYSVPPGYRRQDPPRRPKLEPFTGVIDAYWKLTTGFPGSSAILPSGSLSGCGTSTGSTADTQQSRITSGRTGGGPRRCSCPCPTRQATPSAISGRRWR